MAAVPPLPVMADDLPLQRRPGWREVWLNFRNRLIANPRFQRWAGDFPLTRPVARRNVRDLFNLVAGFVYSQILSACVTLGLFDVLAEGPSTIGVLAPRLRLTEPAAERLLKAAAALKLAERLRDGRFALGPLGAALRGNPAVRAMVEHHALLYRDLADPVALLRGEAGDLSLPRFWAYTDNLDPGAERVSAYSDLMAQSQALVADDVLDAYPIARHRHLVDIGGGDGVFLSEAARRAPQLSLTLFDLPAVVARAGSRFAKAAVPTRIHLCPGNFLTDPLPRGADVMSLVRVLHDHDDAVVETILRKARSALGPGGVLLVAEPMSDTPGAIAAGDAYFGFYLAAMGHGRPRGAPELSDMIRHAGFSHVKPVSTRFPLLVRLLAARV
jgi:demethylspheroidene O-methyltransferase